MADRIVLNSISYHGKGAIENIVPELQNRGKKKVLVCTDASLLKFGVAQKVTDLLDKAGMAYDIYSDIKPNPTIENVQHGVAAFQKAEADSIVAIGGGSAMDTAKAIGIIANNPEFAGGRGPHQESRGIHHRRAHHCRHRRGSDHQLRHHRRGKEAQVRLCGHQRHPRDRRGGS